MGTLISLGLFVLVGYIAVTQFVIPLKNGTEVMPFFAEKKESDENE